MLDIAIQIVNYNTKKYLIDCIDEVVLDLKESAIAYKVMVLDNASNDDLEDLHGRWGGVVEFYRSEKNLGFGGGHNTLAKKSNSEYILIINPDIKFIEKKTIERVLRSIQKERQTGVIGPKLLVEGGGPQPWDHGELMGVRAWVANHVGRSFWRDRSGSMHAAWVSGAFFLIRRSIFEEVDGFDEHFFLYKEEEDLCLRIREKGWRIKYDASVKVMHYGSVVASKDVHMPQSNAYFLQKHFERKWYYSILRWASRAIIK